MSSKVSASSLISSAGPARGDAFAEPALGVSRGADAAGRRGDRPDRSHGPLGDDPAEAETARAEHRERDATPGQQSVQRGLFESALIFGDRGDRLARGDGAAVSYPEHPEQVNVSRPSDALAARLAIDSTLQTLLIGLGAVALVVGGVGVANTMIISVMERRTEIGLRRALGATRGYVRARFLAESMLLALLGGFAGVAMGILITAGFAHHESWPALLPAWASTGAIGVTLAVGTAAGFYPAWRAARMPPTHALGG
jgi:hypothetical protein